MKKLVLKTIAITLAGILATSLLVYGLIALISPKTLAKLHSNLGQYQIAVGYAENQYDKTNNIEDLISLCNYSLQTGDNGLIAGHLGKLFVNDEFKNYTKNDKDFYDFMASRYILSSYSLNSSKQVVEKSFNLTSDYNKGSAAYSLIRHMVNLDLADNSQKENINYFKEQLTNNLSSYSTNGQTRANDDLKMIETYLQ